MDYKNICEIVRSNERNYISGTTAISKYVEWSLYENVEKIDAYLNSKHVSGSTDSLGREKPFFNIVTAAVNIWYRATDIDRKNIRIKASKKDQIIAAFLATAKLQDWMRKDAFGVFLNEWGRTLARYGSAVLKFVVKDGILHSMVIPWNRLIIDAVAFDSDVKIEVLEFTPAQLRKRKGYDQAVVKDLIEAAGAARETMGKQKKDNKNKYIKVYEVHGELPLSLLTDRDADKETYVQQMHVVSFLKSKSKKGEYDDYTLVQGKEAVDPYMITHLIKEDGRVQSIGAVEHLFQAQWMMNHTTKSIKDQLDFASKLVFQTSDGNFVGQNALIAIETGDILIHKLNEPLTQLNNQAHDITNQQNFAAQWKSLGNEITGVAEAMLGKNAPSGSAWHQTEAILNESHSLFEIMTENKGLAIEEMLRRFIIPFLKTQLDTKEEVAMVLSAENITKIETMYVPNEAIRRSNKKMAEKIFNGGIASPADLAAEEAKIKQELSTGVFFTPEDTDTNTWKEVFKDFEWEAEVEVTGEANDSDAMMTTLNTTFATLASLNGQPMTAEMKLIFNKILTETGSISPIEIAQVRQAPDSPQPPQPLPASPSGGQVEAPNGKQVIPALQK